ncbi:ATPase, T2SS/T4P/T4SS family [Paenibacillus thermoaerophilus]|uniref:ATPase, T2SS/T4P/T4SS family n=1 Tax=Paenibacillus thermoaerophilus TaxID=1215385 RepID=A0ABW2V6Z1_9BACL|nr:ATPase, T2SS/T4P/T4SS family [Paenibacillus thermoaerophilus]TMV16115.1 CpaF family protein [Paenibacillus thermoaerophilus]
MAQTEANGFSVLSYMGSRKRAELPVPAGAQERDGAEAGFLQLVEEIRTFLVNERGKSDAEREAYGEALNRAVLGYEEERSRFLTAIRDQLAKRRIPDTPSAAAGGYATLAEAIFAEVIGLNVLESVLGRKEGLEEIQVVGKRVYEVRGGIPVLSAVRFRSLRDVERIQQNLVLFNRDKINLRKRWAEVMLQDGARVTMTGFGFTSEPTLTIRFYTGVRLGLEELASDAFGTLAPAHVGLLRSLLRARVNLVITGATNSGKTSLMKALIGELPDTERLITIEARREMNLKRDWPNKNIIEYETDESDELHNGKQAFKLALRQSPDRICHAEIRDDDANLYVRACTRGHEGSMTTVHVSCLEDVPEAVAEMCMQDGRPMNAVRLAQRIARYVTQVGLEMGVADGKRRLVRMGQYDVDESGRLSFHEWIVWDRRESCWRITGKVRGWAARRIESRDPEGFAALAALGVAEA